MRMYTEYRYVFCVRGFSLLEDERGEEGGGIGGFGHIPLLSVAYVAPLQRSSCLLAALVTCLCCRVSVRLIDDGYSLLLHKLLR